VMRLQQMLNISEERRSCKRYCLVVYVNEALILEVLSVVDVNGALLQS